MVLCTASDINCVWLFYGMIPLQLSQTFTQQWYFFSAALESSVVETVFCSFNIALLLH
jgi:hypothetical protein